MKMVWVEVIFFSNVLFKIQLILVETDHTGY